MTAPARGKRVPGALGFPLSRTGFVRLKRVQAVAGLVLATYVVVHLGNAAACFLGPEARLAYLLRVRAITGNALGEMLWVGLPLAVHAASAMAVWLQERALRRQGERARVARGLPAAPRRKRAPTARLHRATGIALLTLLPIHLATVRFDGLGFGEARGYDRVDALLAAHPALGTLTLAALALAIGYHLGYGAWMALVNLGVLGPGRGRRWGFRAGLVTAIIATATGLAAIGRVLSG